MSTDTIDTKHEILQQMDPHMEKKMKQAATIRDNILNSLNKEEYKSLREYMKEGIKKLLFFIKDSYQGLDRTVLTILYGFTKSMVEDFNACALKEHQQHEFNQKKRQCEREPQEEEEQNKAQKEQDEIQEDTKEINDLATSSPMCD